MNKSSTVTVRTSYLEKNSGNWRIKEIRYVLSNILKFEIKSIFVTVSDSKKRKLNEEEEVEEVEEDVEVKTEEKFILNVFYSTQPIEKEHAYTDKHGVPQYRDTPHETHWLSAVEKKQFENFLNKA